MIGKLFEGVFVVAERAPALIFKPETDVAGLITSATEFFNISEIDNPAVEAFPIRIVGDAESVFIG
jgi:hypothetical protein